MRDNNLKMYHLILMNSEIEGQYTRFGSGYYPYEVTNEKHLFNLYTNLSGARDRT